MKCLLCKKELQIPFNSQLNMDNYHNRILTVTGCCGKPVIGYRVSEYAGQRNRG